MCDYEQCYKGYVTDFILYLRDCVICGKTCFTKKKVWRVFTRITFAVAATANSEAVYSAYVGVKYQQHYVDVQVTDCF